MAVVPQFTANDVRKALLEKQKRLEQAAQLRLARTGEQFITNARNNDTYKDRTGNLRSSIGYVILKDGVQIDLSFPGTGEGVNSGQKIAGEVAEKYPKGFVLIVVAGMDYAAAVESKGYDVLTASGIKAASDLRKALSKLAA